ncbi:hypothetical protein [Synechococcus sp. PCC 7335]|uniref:hypothetical protein n=1 Tax=Synechococcus sp. (strain ATCC 29403 / PCC 7335) TaxID=91464 RepID=UPI0006807D13|nr:hypothetical protein [Synechococcus sp. PCC 7335]
MTSLGAAEVKFLLKLLGCDNYQVSVSELSPSSKTSLAEYSRICESLKSKGLVNYSSEIARFTIAPPGRTLLALDTTSLPVTPDELKVLRACKGSMTPESLGSRVPDNAKQQLIRNLAERRMLKITKSVIKEVWLTTEGKQFLCHDYEPSGNYVIGTADIMAHYVRFLRENLGREAARRSPTEHPR